jgi:Raf kinase inhibitor-like YbhB/YbcL family protein
MISTSFAKEEEKLKITSKSLYYFGNLPRRYTCKGPNVSPPLGWTCVPEGCVSLALILENKDESVVHWLLFNIDPDSDEIPEGVSPEDIGASLGTNDFGQLGYEGPCSLGENHMYSFTLYALKEKLPLLSGVKKGVFYAAISDIIIEEYSFIVFSKID